MANLDDIIDRHIMVKEEELEKALQNVNKSFQERYFCQDGYNVVYNEATGKALYYFPGYTDTPLEMTITPAQRNYLISSDYWRRV